MPTLSDGTPSGTFMGAVTSPVRNCHWSSPPSTTTISCTTGGACRHAHVEHQSRVVSPPDEDRLPSRIRPTPVTTVDGAVCSHQGFLSARRMPGSSRPRLPAQRSAHQPRRRTFQPEQDEESTLVSCTTSSGTCCVSSRLLGNLRCPPHQSWPTGPPTAIMRDTRGVVGRRRTTDSLGAEHQRRWRP